MDYSITPGKHQLREARQKVQNVLDSYSHTLELEDMEVLLGWQKINRDTNVMHDGDSELILVINPEEEMENLERNVLRGLLELEFMEKTDYRELSFKWQEVLKLSYVTARMKKLTDIDTDRSFDPEKWSRFRQLLSEETEDFDEEFHLEAVSLAEKIGDKLLEDYEPEEFPELKMSDVVQAGEQLFGDQT